VIDDRSSSQDSPRGPARSVSELRVRRVPIPLNLVDKSVDTEYDQFPTSQPDSQTSQTGMYISTDPEVRFTAHEVSIEVGEESGLEER
jgi:hypothetical protein